jgi:hypothetical protein
MPASSDFRVDDAHRGRLIDVPNPRAGHGIFEDLHGDPDHAAFSKTIIELALANYGHPSRAYVEQLVAWRQRDEDGLRAWLEERQANYLKQARRIVSPGRDLLRIHGKFATIYAAGRLAQKFKILPWSWSDLRDALLECEEAHVAHVQSHLGGSAHAGAASSAPRSPLDKLRAYLRDNQAKFVDLTKKNPRVGEYDDNPPGYLIEHQGQREFLFSNDAFLRLAGGKGQAQALKAELAQRGLIAMAGGGKEGDRYAVKRPIRTADGEVRRSVIAIDARVLQDQG